MGRRTTTLISVALVLGIISIYVVPALLSRYLEAQPQQHHSKSRLLAYAWRKTEGGPL